MSAGREPPDERLGAVVERIAATLRGAFEENERLRDEVRRVRDSARYRLGDLALSVRPTRAVLDVPARLLELYRAKGGGEASVDDAAFADRLEAFARRVARSSAPWVVFSFTGTRLGGIRASRPFAMTRVLEGRGIPVLFGHAGASDPSARADLVLELPESFLSPRLEAIAALDFGDRKKIFVTSYPTGACARAINTFAAAGWVTAYDALDDWEAFARAGVGTWFSAGAEQYLVHNADFTTAVSAPLVEKLTGPSREIALSANALDPGFVPPRYARRPTAPPRVGYFGHLTPAWFDWESVAALARSRPEYRFEIIGHDAPRGLALPENVRLLGPRWPREIPEIAGAWSAAIIPFRIGPLSRAVDPIKIYEYLALGLPTVSFTMPQIAGYPATTTVGDVGAFAAALDRAVGSTPDRSVVRQFLAHNTWDVRVDALLERAALAPARRSEGGERPVLLFTASAGLESVGLFAFFDLAARVAWRADVEVWVVSAAPAGDVEGRVLFGLAEALELSDHFRWFAGLGAEAIAAKVADAGRTGGAHVTFPGDGPAAAGPAAFPIGERALAREAVPALLAALARRAELADRSAMGDGRPLGSNGR